MSDSERDDVELSLEDLRSLASEHGAVVGFVHAFGDDVEPLFVRFVRHGDERRALALHVWGLGDKQERFSLTVVIDEASLRAALDEPLSAEHDDD